MVYIITESYILMVKNVSNLEISHIRETLNLLIRTGLNNNTKFR